MGASIYLTAGVIVQPLHQALNSGFHKHLEEIQQLSKYPVKHRLHPLVFMGILDRDPKNPPNIDPQTRETNSAIPKPKYGAGSSWLDSWKPSVAATCISIAGANVGMFLIDDELVCNICDAIASVCFHFFDYTILLLHNYIYSDTNIQNKNTIM